jgi:YgiT-type zinc finger domain-containing protein
MGGCYFCKGKTDKQRVTVDYRWGDKLVIIKNVPAEVCSQCGERYFDAEISRHMEAIVLSEEKPRFSITVPVCEFAGAE